jgi:hypothetical protein
VLLTSSRCLESACRHTCKACTAAQVWLKDAHALLAAATDGEDQERTVRYLQTAIDVMAAALRWAWRLQPEVLPACSSLGYSPLHMVLQTRSIVGVPGPCLVAHVCEPFRKKKSFRTTSSYTVVVCQLH